MKRIVFVLGVIGMLFAGYISMVTFLSNACAFDKPCPYFLGYPACYFGFVMYLVLFLLSLGLVSKKLSEKTALLGILGVSFLGILFAGNYTIAELPLLLEKGFGAYVLVLPTCALGLIFYILIFSLSLWRSSKLSEI